MIVDARREAPTRPVECDVCIVGGGPAGLLLAREMDDGRRRIVLLEAGGLRHEATAQSLLAGEDDGSYPPLGAARLSALGGSTHVWAGWCRPLDAIDFEPRDGRAHSGWPFGREALDAHYADVHDLLDLGEFDYDPQSWERALGSAAPRLAGDPAAVAPVLFRKVALSLPRRLVADLRASDSIRAMIHTPSLRILTDPDSGSALGVQAAADARRPFDIHARTVVLACGGIENARLMLLSDIGAGRDLVGRHFTEHVYVEAGTFVPARRESMAFLLQQSVGQGPARRTARGAWALGPSRLRQEGLLNGALYLQPAYEFDPCFMDARVQSALAAWDMLRGRAVPHSLARRVLHGATAPHLVLRAALRRMRNDPVIADRWRLRGLFECGSDPDNRVELTDERDAMGRRTARVRWRVTDEEIHSVRRTHEILDEALRRSGAGHLELPPPEMDAWRDLLKPALHHLGTTRMHDDPRRGVVDANGRVHGIDNLYVAGGSVFPTGGYANPTLTILALSLRLATHLRAQMAMRG